MENPETARAYPAAPLESVVVHEEQQSLLKTAPPTYDQATETAIPALSSTVESGPTVVVVTQPTTALLYGPHPVDVLCPYCRNYTRTRIRHEPSSRTHLVAFLLCMLQLYCCVCLPYLIGSCMKTNHYCGLCDNYLATYGRP